MSEQSGIQELHMTPGRIDVIARHPEIHSLMEELVSFFRDAGAENYAEMKAWHVASGDQYSILIQRRAGKTPAEINSELKAVNAELTTRLQQAEREREAMRPVVEAARALREAVRAFNRSPGHLRRAAEAEDALCVAVDALEGGGSDE